MVWVRFCCERSERAFKFWKIEISMPALFVSVRVARFIPWISNLTTIGGLNLFLNPAQLGNSRNWIFKNVPIFGSADLLKFPSFFVTFFFCDG